MANASDIWSCESCSFSTVASEYEGAFLRSRCWYTDQRSTVLWLCRFYQQGTNGLLFILGLLFLDILPWKLFRESCQLFASEATGPFGCGNDSNGFQFSTCRPRFLKPCVNREYHLGSRFWRCLCQLDAVGPKGQERFLGMVRTPYIRLIIRWFDCSLPKLSVS